MGFPLMFLLVFVGAPLVELYFLLQVGDRIGAFNTVGLVVLTAVVGGFLVRLQGFTTLLKVREAMSRDEVPAFEMIEGALLMVAGLLLLLPGFVTDVFGFLVLIPPLRRLAIVQVLRRAQVIHPGGQRPPGGEGAPGQVIDGESWREDDGANERIGRD